MRSFFQGWYFKQQTSHETIAVIPALHIDEYRQKSASIQVITDSGSYHAPYSYAALHSDKRDVQILLGGSRFSKQGILLNIRKGGLSVTGELAFGPVAPLRYDIMGPFRLVPFMECRHSVYSMFHRVDGILTVNGRRIVFENAVGYLEGDRGTSFPANYVWTHCAFENGSVMLSVAKIPMLGAHFSGVIGVVWQNGTEYRLATYLGARAVSVTPDRIEVRQGASVLTVERLSSQNSALRAPVKGCMTRLIRESPSCSARYRFVVNGTCLINLQSNMASFEYEYDKPLS